MNIGFRPISASVDALSSPSARVRSGGWISLQNESRNFALHLYQQTSIYLDGGLNVYIHRV